MAASLRWGRNSQEPVRRTGCPACFGLGRRSQGAWKMLAQPSLARRSTACGSGTGHRRSGLPASTKPPQRACSAVQQGQQADLGLFGRRPAPGGGEAAEQPGQASAEQDGAADGAAAGQGPQLQQRLPTGGVGQVWAVRSWRAPARGRRPAAPGAAQVLHCEDELALVDGLDSEAPLGTLLQVSNGGTGCALPGRMCSAPAQPATGPQPPHAGY